MVVAKQFWVSPHRVCLHRWKQFPEGTILRNLADVWNSSDEMREFWFDNLIAAFLALFRFFGLCKPEAIWVSSLAGGGHAELTGSSSPQYARSAVNCWCQRDGVQRRPKIWSRSRWVSDLIGDLWDVCYRICLGVESEHISARSPIKTENTSNQFG